MKEEDDVKRENDALRLLVKEMDAAGRRITYIANLLFTILLVLIILILIYIIYKQQ